MVNYESVKVGLEVEFVVGDEIHAGIVRYKGPINGKQGDWIGVETHHESISCDSIFDFFSDQLFKYLF